MKRFSLKAVRSITATICLAAGAFNNAYSETVFLAPYPAPGGHTEVPTGDPSRLGGMNVTYSGLDFSAFGDLGYVVGSYSPFPTNFVAAGPELTMDGTIDLLSYNAGLSDLVNGQVVWTGQTHLDWFNGGVPTNSPVDTRFTLAVTDISSNPLALTDVSTIPEIPDSLGGMHIVTGDFKVNWLFEAVAPDTLSWEPALDMFDRIDNDPNSSVTTNVGEAFYYTAPVPIPASIWLLGFGIVGLTSIARRTTEA